MEKELGLTGNKPNPPGAEEAAVSSDENTENMPSIMVGRSMAGIDFSSGLKRFDDNEETYLRIISSYFIQIQTIVEKLQNRTTVQHMGDYRLTVHSLKSTSYTIGAKHIGNMAEELEKAATAGDMDYISAHNSALVESLEKLIPVLKNFLDEIQSARQKPLRKSPDQELLSALLKASVDYDMEQMDAIMTKLEQYRYESQADLITSLRQEFDKSEFENIRKHLENLK
jgi:HPt (histidine-containing phosphotransfer) domain-containing protein